MEQLWSPWRSAYIHAGDERESSGCFLCHCAQQRGADLDSLVVAAFVHCVVVMNRYPYNAGHLLIAPRIHEGALEALPKIVAAEMMEVLQRTVEVTNAVLHPHGCNVGANLGRHAGAGVPDHLHFHVVPRWSGDTNFMPVLAEVKVVSDSLEQMWHQFSAAFAERGTRDV